MPGKNMRPEKVAIRTEIRAKLEGCDQVILTDCRGLTVEQLKELRSQLKEADGFLMVVPNAIFGLAARDLGWNGIDPFLAGPTAIVSGRGEITRMAKAIKTFSKATKLPVVKGGLLEGRVLSAADVEALASIPSREVLIGQLVGTIAAPLTGLVSVMSRKVSSLVVVLNAIAENKSGGK